MVTLTPCLVYDAICYLQQRFMSDKQWMKPEQIAVIEELNEQFMDKLSDGCIGMSALSMLVDTFGENVQLWTLDELIAAFSDMEIFSAKVTERMTNEWYKSCYFPILDLLKDGALSVLLSDLNVLKDGEFERFWHERIRPQVEENIIKKKEILKSENIDSYLEGISQLKGIGRLDEIVVYVSYMSYPVAFSLYHGFLTVMTEKPLAQLLGHELMHGFSNSETTELYCRATQINDFLIEQHRRLIEDYHSGNEEEMVMAAEYYLAYKAGKPLEILMPEAKNKYGGCCSISVVIFCEMVKEKNTITNYNAWLTDFFNRTDFSVISPEYVSDIQ